MVISYMDNKFQENMVFIRVYLSVKKWRQNVRIPFYCLGIIIIVKQKNQGIF